jgi:hypothetical protein
MGTISRIYATHRSSERIDEELIKEEVTFRMATQEFV